MQRGGEMCAAATGVRVPHSPSPGPSEPLLQATPATSTFSTKRGVPETFIQGFTLDFRVVPMLFKPHVQSTAL